MRKKKIEIEHYLITIDLHPQPARMHSYVMTNDKRCLAWVMDQMFAHADKQGLRITLPIILQTKLSTGSEIVRDILRDLSPKADEALRAAKDFHYSIFMSRVGHVDDKRLMELH